MRNYISPVAKVVFYDEQDIIRTSSGFTTLGKDNGVYWPGETESEEDSIWE